MSLFVVAMLIFASCKRNVDDVSKPDTASSLQKDESFTSRTITGKDTLEIARFTYRTGSRGEIPEFNLTFNAPQNLLQSLSNLRLVIRLSTTDSVVLIDPIVQDGFWDERVPLEKNRAYPMSVYVNAPSSTFGTITTSAEVSNGDRTTGLKEGQTMTFSPYHSIPKFTWHELSGVIQDSVEMDLYSFSITNTGKGRISFPQFTLAVNLSDVGSNDTLSILSPKWMVNGSDSTQRVIFTNSTGTPITMIPEGISTLRIPVVQGSREWGIPPGQMYTFTLRGTPAGFHRDGNGMSQQLLSDATQLNPLFQFLTIGTSGSNVKVTTTQPSSGTGTVVNLPWSPNGPSHSAISGTSSKDFTNGFGFPSLGVQQWHQ